MRGASFELFAVYVSAENGANRKPLALSIQSASFFGFSRVLVG